MKGKAAISYTDSRGNVFDLMSDGIRRVKSASFHEFSWDREVGSKRFGEKIYAFKKSAAQYSATIYFDGPEREKNLNSFHDAIEYDIIRNEPGTLRWEDYTIECFVVQSKTYPADEKFGAPAANDVVFYCPDPFWKKVQSYSSYTANDRPVIEVYMTSTNPISFTNTSGQPVTPIEGTIYVCKTNGQYLNHEFIWRNESYADITPSYMKSYEESYPYEYDYKADFESYLTLYNDNALGSSYIAIIYGPCTNPDIIIANDGDEDDLEISIKTTVGAGARLIVDMTEKTVTKITAKGTSINCFGQRDLDAGYLWTKIPFGLSHVIWDNSFDFDLLLIEERSEPKWLLG